VNALSGVTRNRDADLGRVVLVEDVPADRALMAEALGERRYAVAECDASDALERAAEVGPRLIVLSADVRNGFNLCLRVKKAPALRRVPLLLVTGKSTPDMVRKHRMLPTRADGYLLKPMTRESFLRAVAELLPEDFRASPARIERLAPDRPAFDREVREDEDSDVRERTLVHQGAQESAVVAYVEEEVRTLKDIVSRLESEKAGLMGRLVDLEAEIRSDRNRLDSGLKMIEHKTAEPPAERVDEARRKGFEEGLVQGMHEGRAELEKFRAAAADTSEQLASRIAEVAQLRARVAESEGLASRLAEQQAAREAADQEARAARQEIAETTILFERLEAGYKASLEEAQAERLSFEQNVSKLETELEQLRERAASVEQASTEIMDLRQAAARAEIVDEECRGLRAQLQHTVADLDAARAEAQSLRDRAAAASGIEERVAGLERDLAAALDDASAAREAREFARSEAASLRTKFSALRSLLGETTE